VSPEFYVERFYAAAFLHRTETADELWMGILDFRWSFGIAYGTASAEDFEEAKLMGGVSCRFAVRRKGDDLAASLRLMEVLFRAVHGYEFYEEFIAPGILDKSAYDGLVGRLENEWEENRRKARARETEIIKVARELGLNPFPTGDNPDYWMANCPGKNHPLYFNAALNSYGCGYCQRTDGVEGLRAFVKERRGQ
jgi:hypothetical protein